MPCVSPFIVYSNCLCVRLVLSSSCIIIDSGNGYVLMLLNWKIIQYSLKRGSISSNLVFVLGSCATAHASMNDVKKANEFAATAQALFPRIRDDNKVYVGALLPVYSALCLSRPFRSLTGPSLQAYKDLKVSCD